MAEDKPVTRRGRRPPRIGEAFSSILTSAQAGGAWAFERLYEAFAPPVAGYLRLQGAADPDDLTNEVFLNVFSGLGSFSGDEGQFRSWVFTIAHHRLIDERRNSALLAATVANFKRLGVLGAFDASAAVVIAA